MQMDDADDFSRSSAPTVDLATTSGRKNSLPDEDDVAGQDEDESNDSAAPSDAENNSQTLSESPNSVSVDGDHPVDEITHNNKSHGTEDSDGRDAVTRSGSAAKGTSSVSSIPITQRQLSRQREGVEQYDKYR